MIVGGRIGDLRGRRRWLVIGTVAFGLSSLAGGLAPNAETLIAMRLVQGVAAGFSFPLSLAVVTNAFPQSQGASGRSGWCSASRQSGRPSGHSSAGV